MSKTRNAIPDYFTPANCIMIAHTYAFSGEPGPPEFHSITAWNYLWFQPFGPVILCDWDPLNPPPGYTITPVQIAAAIHLLHDPGLISDICPDCNGLRPTPNAIRWNLHRSGMYPYGVPACLYDDSWPIVWSPDQATLIYPSY